MKPLNICKHFIILLISVFFIFIISCKPTANIKTTETSTAPSTAEPITVTSVVKVEDTQKIEELEKQLDLKDEEIKKYQSLIANLNELLKNVYYGYARNDKYEANGFTAFSLEYKGKYYLITAGHAVHYKFGGVDTGKYTYFKFKANFSNTWIYPKLLVYDNHFNSNIDYAVFEDKSINTGFKIGKAYGDNFILGSMNNKLNVVRKLLTTPINGESGSPVINLNGEVIGIFTGGVTYIDIVTKAIDNLK